MRASPFYPGGGENPDRVSNVVSYIACWCALWTRGRDIDHTRIQQRGEIVGERGIACGDRDYTVPRQRNCAANDNDRDPRRDDDRKPISVSLPHRWRSTAQVSAEIPSRGLCLSQVRFGAFHPCITGVTAVTEAHWPRRQGERTKSVDPAAYAALGRTEPEGHAGTVDPERRNARQESRRRLTMARRAATVREPSAMP